MGLRIRSKQFSKHRHSQSPQSSILAPYSRANYYYIQQWLFCRIYRVYFSATGALAGGAFSRVTQSSHEPT